MLQACILDMYNGQAGQGIPAIKLALAEAGYDKVTVIDVRAGENMPPPQAAHMWVSSGGPGNPADCGDWGAGYGAWLDSLMAHNLQNPQNLIKAWLICHSFQVASVYWGLGRPMKRPQGGLKGIFSQHNLSNHAVTQTWESRFFGIYKWQNIDFEQKNLVKLACDNPAEALTAWQSQDGAIMATQYHPEVTPQAATRIFDAAPNLPKANPFLLAPTYQGFTAFLCGARVVAR